MAVEQDTHYDLLGKCESYLAAQHCTLWGRSFDVKDDASRTEGAAWLAAQIEQLHDHIEAAEPPNQERLF